MTEPTIREQLVELRRLDGVVRARLQTVEHDVEMLRKTVGVILQMVEKLLTKIEQAEQP